MTRHQVWTQMTDMTLPLQQLQLVRAPIAFLKTWGFVALADAYLLSKVTPLGDQAMPAVSQASRARMPCQRRQQL
jgi:hypothetical protein